MASDVNTDVIREAFGRVVYTHKTHEKARELAARATTQLKVANIVLTALTFGGIVGVVTSEQSRFVWASLILSTLSLAFTIVQLSFDPAKEASRHRAAAKSFLSIRDRYIHLIADADAGMAQDDLRARRDELQQELDELNLHAPDTSARAYKKASKALNANEELTFNPGEVDAFLPDSLRSNRAGAR